MSYLISRLTQIFIIIFILTYAVYNLIDLMPGDAITRLKQENPSLKPEDLERLKKQRGLDKPSYIRYFYWLKNLVKDGYLGYSEIYKQSVAGMMGDRLITTLKVILPVFILTLSIAIPVGVFSALKQYSKFDYAVNLFAFIAFSVPTFVTGLLVIYLLAKELNLFPPGGLGTPGATHFLDEVRYLVLPVLVLCFYESGQWIRYVRGTMLEVLKQDYIRTARAKGLSEDEVIFKHALKNVFISFITLLALFIPLLFGGALITETVFGINGMGRLLYDSIKNSDTDVAMAAFLFLSLMTMLANFGADILYTAVDPRIRIGAKK